MDGKVVATSLLAFKQTLSSKKTIVEQVKTEKRLTNNRDVHCQQCEGA
jgi:hypothetical protein